MNSKRLKLPYKGGFRGEPRRPAPPLSLKFCIISIEFSEK